MNMSCIAVCKEDSFMSVGQSMAAEVHIYQIIMIWRRILSPALFSPFPGFSERDMMDSLSDRLGRELVVATPAPYVTKSNHFLPPISVRFETYRHASKISCSVDLRERHSVGEGSCQQ